MNIFIAVGIEQSKMSPLKSVLAYLDFLVHSLDELLNEMA